MLCTGGNCILWPGQKSAFGVQVNVECAAAMDIDLCAVVGLPSGPGLEHSGLAVYSKPQRFPYFQGVCCAFHYFYGRIWLMICVVSLPKCLTGLEFAAWPFVVRSCYSSLCCYAPGH